MTMKIAPVAREPGRGRDTGAVPAVDEIGRRIAPAVQLQPIACGKIHLLERRVRHVIKRPHCLARRPAHPARDRGAITTNVLGRDLSVRRPLWGGALPPGDARPVEIVLEAERRSLLAEACPVDLNVGQHLANILARLLDRDALDPVDGIDVGIARIAELPDPLPGAPRPGVVAGDASECRSRRTRPCGRAI